MKPEEFEKYFNRRLAYNQFSPDYESLLLSTPINTVVAPTGVATEIFNYTTQEGREGGFVSFYFGFDIFVPGAAAFTWTLYFNNAAVPRTDGEGIFDISRFINQEVPYFQYFNNSGANVLRLVYTNNDIVNHFPYLRMRGLYLHGSVKQ